MKYLFGDSTEFPLQKDFLKLLDNFVDTSVKTIALENTVFDLKETVRDRRILKKSVLDEMDNFLSSAGTSISKAFSRTKEKDAIVEHADKSKFFLKQFIDEGKKNYSNEIFHEIVEYEEKIDTADEDNRVTLESFFQQNPIPTVSKTYTLKAAKKGYSAKVKADYEEDISCVFDIPTFELPFWENHIKASKFVKDIEIPIKMKKQLLKKELAPEMVELDNYYFANLRYSGKDLEVVFQKKLVTSAERLTFKMNLTDESAVKAYYTEENGVENDIMAVPELKNELDIHKLHELGQKIQMHVDDLYSKKQKLELISLNGKDIFEENLMFGLMQNIAKILAKTVAEIENHSPSKEELSLKVESGAGERSEIYLKKSNVRDKLDSIKEKGDRLFEILGI